ncbi:hypothetical protein ANO14919_005230 [Xylariales sp. No.14919]|nr:hypothetical protein F5X98DRAFT_156830 [Xylaria grammica]GAW11181.1 hypothetical protein ANO14919_005230 [Xylariales sp. No.14919]
MHTMMPTRQHSSGFSHGAHWIDPSLEPASRIRNEQDRIKHEQEKTALPPIRQAFPELQLDVQRDGLARTPPSAISPIGAQFNGTITPPEYVHSPNRCKRRRLSIDEERELDRVNQVPRFYAGSRPQSPTPKSRPALKQWIESDCSSPYARDGMIPSMRSPVAIETHERAEARPTLPSLPLLNFERGVNETYRMQSHASDEYMSESSRRPSLVPGSGHCVDLGGQPYRPASFSYGYHHPNRLQSLSVGSAHLDRTPFSPGAYGPHFQESFMRIGDFSMGTNGDGKQRKRRGNLPKETTDKLRAWFVAHLHHPYPTEDEKQELMRQTGLQMNQISNWFINARRRQLPAMISNARAESDAMNNRSVDGKTLSSSSERIDYDAEGKHQSDSEGSNFEDLDIESAKRHRTTDLKRGSI